MPRKIFISDIHGCLKTFDGLLKQLALKEEDHLFLLGDYYRCGCIFVTAKRKWPGASLCFRLDQ